MRCGRRGGRRSKGSPGAAVKTCTEEALQRVAFEVHCGKRDSPGEKGREGIQTGNVQAHGKAGVREALGKLVGAGHY